MQRTRHDRVANKGPVALMVSEHQPIEFSIVGEQNLARWTELAYADERAQASAAAVAEHRRQRHELSRSHQKEWTDTVEGQVEEKKRRRQAAVEEAEARRVAIDELEREFQTQLKAQMRNEAAEKLLARDPRMKALNSAVLHQQVIEERDQQELLSARKRDFHRAQEDAYTARLMEQVAREEAMEKERQEQSRAQTFAAREACRLQLEALKVERRAQREADKEEGRRLRLIAEQEADDLRQSATEKRAALKSLNFDRLKQRAEQEALSPRPPPHNNTSPLHRPTQLTSEDHDVVSRHIMTKLAIQQAVEEEARRKREALEQRSATVAEALSQRGSPRKVALLEQSWNTARSANERMLEADAQRVSARKDLAKQAQCAIEEQIAHTARLRDSFKDNEARLKNMLQRRAQEWRADDEAEIRERKSEAARLKEIHLLQQRMKELNEQRYREEELAGGRAQNARLVEDELAFRDEVLRRMPPQMEAGLVRRVMAVL